MLKVDLWNIIFIIINLIVLYIIMRFVAVKPLRNVISKRESIVGGSLRNAAEKEAEAKALEAEWRSRLDHVSEESAKLMEKAKADADVEYARLVSDANSEAERIVKNARRNMEAERSRIMDDVQSEIAGLAIDITKKVLETSDLAGINDSLYEKFLTETGDENDSVGN